MLKLTYIHVPAYPDPGHDISREKGAISPFKMNLIQTDAIQHLLRSSSKCDSDSDRPVAVDPALQLSGSSNRRDSESGMSSLVRILPFPCMYVCGCVGVL
jgi:hypothetical protein